MSRAGATNVNLRSRKKVLQGTSPVQISSSLSLHPPFQFLRSLSSLLRPKLKRTKLSFFVLRSPCWKSCNPLLLSPLSRRFWLRGTPPSVVRVLLAVPARCDTRCKRPSRVNREECQPRRGFDWTILCALGLCVLCVWIKVPTADLAHQLPDRKLGGKWKIS